MIIDGSGQVMGRLASLAASKLLRNEPVTIINCSKVIVNGTPKEVVKAMRRKLNLGSSRWGPFIPRTPARLMRRAVRGMLPYKKPRGRLALARLKCHTSAPEGLKPEKLKVNPPKLRIYKRITLGELCQQIGRYKGV